MAHRVIVLAWEMLKTRFAQLISPACPFCGARGCRSVKCAEERLIRLTW